MNLGIRKLVSFFGISVLIIIILKSPFQQRNKLKNKNNNNKIFRTRANYLARGRATQKNPKTSMLNRNN